MGSTKRKNKKKIVVGAVLTAFAFGLSVGSAYSRTLDWASAELVYTPEDAGEYSSDCLIVGGQLIRLSDWQAEETERTVCVNISRPAPAETPPTTQLPNGSEGEQSTDPEEVTTTPEEETTTPEGETTAPEEETNTPEEETTTPEEETTTPEEVTTSTQDEIELTQEETPSPQEVTTSTQDEIEPMQEETPSPQERTVIPQEVTTSTQDETEPTKDETEPTQDETEPTQGETEPTQGETEPSDGSETEETTEQPDESWLSSEVTVTMSDTAVGYLTCEAWVGEDTIELVFKRVEAVQQTTPVEIAVEWYGLEGTFCFDLLPATMAAVEEAPAQVLTFTKDGEPLNKVRWSVDGGENYTLLYDSSQLNLPEEPLVLDFSFAVEPGESLTVALASETITFVWQPPVKETEQVVKATGLPHKFEMKTGWGEAKLELRIQYLTADAEGDLVYMDDEGMTASVMEDGILLEAARETIYPASGSYRLMLDWRWNGIVLQEQTVYFFVNTN